MRKKPPAELNRGRFDRRIDWARVQDRERDCWIWTSTCSRSMTGKRRPWVWCREDDGTERKVSARRLGFELEFSRVLDSEEWLGLLTCGEDLCVNPYHAKVTDAHDWRTDAGLAKAEPRGNKPKTEEEFI